MPSQQGARFLLEVPASTWESKTDSNAGMSGGDEALTVPQWDGQGLRVLLAEDNEINVLYAKALLDRWNVELYLAKDGAEALEQWSTTSFDVVLLDVQMPVMDGLEVLRRIREQEQQRQSDSRTRVFMVTAFADKETRGKARQFGASGFLSKPFSPAQMMEILVSEGRQLA